MEKYHECRVRWILKLKTHTTEARVIAQWESRCLACVRALGSIPALNK
jgi:hypothetical protein